jgi:hypothetical protein
VAASRWTEPPRRLLRELVRELRGLRGNERLAVAGVAGILFSLLLPWYGFPLSGDPLAQTGFGAFSFAEAALLAVCGAVVFLALQVGGGYAPPRPLTEWGLFVAAGVWAALIVGYRMLDRPELDLDLDLVTIETTYQLRYGIFVALGGALLIVAAGLRARRHHVARRAPARDDSRQASGGG